MIARLRPYVVLVWIVAGIGPALAQDVDPVVRVSPTSRIAFRPGPAR
jgi:hypothetical protein